mgnify:CR=1 FL=1
MTPCRADRRWCRWWAGYAATAFALGVSTDTLAYVRHGYDATLTSHLRRWSGLEPRTRYGRLGQAAIAGFLGWAMLHLTFGILGPTRRRG